MPAVAGRAPRKHKVQTLVPFFTRVPEVTRRTANDRAQELGVSLSLYLEDLIERDRRSRETGDSSATDPSAA